MKFKQPIFLLNMLKNKISLSNAQEQKPAGGKCSSDDKMEDNGNAPYAFDIYSKVRSNENFRTALWTGSRLQLTEMTIPKGEDIGLEMHDSTDQFLYVVDGAGEVSMGRCKQNQDYKMQISEGYGILVPAGTYHNIKSSDSRPLKLFSIYAPKVHPFGTVTETKEE